MNEQRARCNDVIVVGGGPGGALTAMMLASRGRRVTLIERNAFPRFAVGESSTPIASRTLQQIATDYGIPELLPLTNWGRWCQSQVERSDNHDTRPLTGGLKRGFTYYDHRPASGIAQFSAQAYWPNRSSERLLVAASPSDAEGDTHWVRAEVDSYLIEICRQRGVEIRLGWRLDRIERAIDDTWCVHLLDEENEPDLLSCETLVDASGRSGAVVRCLAYRDATASLRTSTAACFTHVIGTEESANVDCDLLPYRPHDAAVHHLLHDGWLWQLPMSDGRTSVGRVWHRLQSTPKTERPQAKCVDLVDNLDVQHYATLRNWLSPARLAAVPRRWLRADRVQHRWYSPTPMTASMLPLPTTLATIDPLHSTGLAHAITGAQRVSELILRADVAAITRYAHQVQCEIELLDRVISLAYRVWSRTDLFFDACMLYFALAISDEEERVEGGFDLERSTWRATDSRTRHAIGQAEAIILRAFAKQQPIERRTFVATMGRLCHVPLACRDDNLYAYTFA
jgi:FADH2 O2-dependent halogenase